MNVTITTDASFYHTGKVGGFAFQIKSNAGLIKEWGPLQGKISNPTEAELKSLMNALHMLIQKDYKISTLTINTDCKFIVDSTFNVKKSWKPVTKRLVKEFHNYIFKLNYDRLNIKHVKAHTGDLTGKVSWVNDWCDRKSREGSKLASKIEAEGKAA
jgi:ribonuclease HI